MQFVFSKVVSNGKKAKFGGHGENRGNVEQIQGVEGMVTAMEEGEDIQRFEGRVKPEEEEEGVGDRFALSAWGSECYPFSQDVYWCSKSSLSNVEGELC